MASEETEVAAQNAAPTKPRATGSSVSRRGILAGLRERLKRIRLIDLLPGLVLGAAVMALYTYYSLQQVKHWVTLVGPCNLHADGPGVLALLRADCAD